MNPNPTEKDLEAARRALLRRIKEGELGKTFTPARSEIVDRIDEVDHANR